MPPVDGLNNEAVRPGARIPEHLHYRGLWRLPRPKLRRGNHAIYPRLDSL